MFWTIFFAAARASESSSWMKVLSSHAKGEPEQLTAWIDGTFIHEEDSDALATAKKLVQKKSWDTIMGYKESQWSSLVGSKL